MSSIKKDFVYADFEDGKCKITRYLGNDVDVVIPSEIDGNIVSTIGSQAFKKDYHEHSHCGCHGHHYSNDEDFKLRTVTIPDTVSYIEREAFKGCKFLERVIILGPVRIIDKEAFAECPKLSDISLNEGLEKIYDRAFFGTLLQKDNVLPSSVIFVGEDVFGSDK